MDIDHGQLYAKLLDFVTDLENQYNERLEAYCQAARTIEDLGRKIGIFSESFEIIPRNQLAIDTSNNDIINDSTSDSIMEIKLETAEEMKEETLNRRNIEPPLKKRSSVVEEAAKFEPITKDGYITIGQNGTEIKIEDYNKINWNSASAATRTLLSHVFDAKTLATHSLSGRPSPAFVNRNKKRPVKHQLDSKKVHDVVNAVLFKCDIAARDVRAFITIKCSDAAKLLKYKTRKPINKKKK